MIPTPWLSELWRFFEVRAQTVADIHYYVVAWIRNEYGHPTVSVFSDKTNANAKDSVFRPYYGSS